MTSTPHPGLLRILNELCDGSVRSEVHFTEGHVFDEPRNEVERILSVLKAARAISESTADWWQRLTEAADAVVTRETLSALYRQALAAMQVVLGADEVSIVLANEAEDALIARASIGLGEEEIVSLVIPAGEGMAGRVLASRQPLIVSDLSQVTLVSPVLRDQGLRSIVAVPILSAEKTLGVLHAGSRQLDHFTEADTELLGLLADRLSVALERVHIFEEQHRLAEVASFLAETAKIMASADDFISTLDELARAALPVLGDICLIDIADDDGLTRMIARHVDPARQELVDRLRTEFPPSINGRHPAAEVLSLGSTRWAPTMSDDFLRATTHNEDHFTLTKTLGFQSYVVVPISTRHKTIGALTLVSSSRSFTTRDVEIAESLADEVGSLVAKAWQFDIAAQTSHVLQVALLPTRLPEISGLIIHTGYAAATATLEVGGDFYDVMALPDGQAWILIGDVEGHDRRAAAVMGQLRSAARTLACHDSDPGAVIRGLRTCWSSFEFERLATVLAGRIDPATGALSLASAGHLPPLLIREEAAEFLSVAPSPILGVESKRTTVIEATLRPGEVLLFYTDGVLQERTLTIVDGLEQLCKVALEGDINPQSLCDRLFQLDPDRDDDLAVIAISIV